VKGREGGEKGAVGKIGEKRGGREGVERGEEEQ